MTVCVAAIAADGGIIVCVADKSISYGHVAWDSDSKKIIPLASNHAVALTAGSDRYNTRLLHKIQNFDGYLGPLDQTITYLEQKYQECVIEMQNTEILLPYMLTRDEYVAAISSASVNPHIRNIEDQIRRFHDEFDCEMIICGFAEKLVPYILCIKPPGVVIDCTNNGFQASGSGAEIAMSRLLFNDYKKANGVAHVLFDCFDAKVYAEMSAYVGYDWDACFLQGGRVRTLLPEAKPLLDKVWAKRNRSPFKKKRDPDDLRGPPRRWEMILREIVAKSLGSAFDETGEHRDY
jgi:hypothetical protein